MEEFFGWIFKGTINQQQTVVDSWTLVHQNSLPKVKKSLRQTDSDFFGGLVDFFGFLRPKSPPLRRVLVADLQRIHRGFLDPRRTLGVRSRSAGVCGKNTPGGSARSRVSPRQTKVRPSNSGLTPQ